MNKIVYVDMDNVLVDFKSGIDKLSPAELAEFDGRFDEVPNLIWWRNVSPLECGY